MKLQYIIIAVTLLVMGCSAPKEQMNPHVILETSKGAIELELYPKQAPATVDNFLKYVNSSFYDGTVFHRVIPGFMVQGGGFISDGAQKPTSSPIDLESSNGLNNDAGTVAMARTSDPDSATSQFFINVANNTFLNYAQGNDGYAVFGKVVNGMDVVKSIMAVKTGNRQGMSDWPTEDITLTKAYVKK